MLEKQNAVERKTAAGDAAELDDIIEAGTKKFACHDAPCHPTRQTASDAGVADRRF